MRILLFVFALVCVMMATDCHAQFGRKKKKAEKERVYAADVSSRSPESKPSTTFSSEKKFSKKKFPTAAEGIKKAHDLYAANAKKNAKMAEELASNPRYADPSYFGHKHKPKKHRPGKKKYCKECGIAH